MVARQDGAVQAIHLFSQCVPRLTPMSYTDKKVFKGLESRVNIQSILAVISLSVDGESEMKPVGVP